MTPPPKLGTLAVLDQFFGAKFGTQNGPQPIDIALLPPEQLTELIRRVIDSSASEFRRLEANPSQDLAPLGLWPDWWNDSSGLQIQKIKAISCYAPHAVVPDPFWDVAEELASYAAIRSGIDPRNGLLSAFNRGLDIRPYYEKEDTSIRGKIYPSTSLEARVRRMESLGNDCRPLLVAASESLADLRPVVDVGAVRLDSYSDRRLGLTRTFANTNLRRLIAVHESICADTASCLSKEADTASCLSKEVEKLRDFPPNDHHWLDFERPGDAIDELAQRLRKDRTISLLRHLIEEKHFASVPTDNEVLTRQIYAYDNFCAASWETKAFLDRYAILLRKRRGHRATTSDILELSQFPGLRAASFHDIATVIEDDHSIFEFRAALGNALSPLHADDPSTLQADVDGQVADHVRAASVRLTRSARKWPKRAAVAGGATAAGVAVLATATDTVSAAGLVSAAAAQIPWLANVLDSRETRIEAARGAAFSLRSSPTDS